VHNTGHFTIEACASSQFENHARVITGLPLGSPEMVAPAACRGESARLWRRPRCPPRSPAGPRRSRSARPRVWKIAEPARAQDGTCDRPRTDGRGGVRAQQAADCLQFGGE
jgi:hypothetical protein